MTEQFRYTFVLLIILIPLRLFSGPSNDSTITSLYPPKAHEAVNIRVHSFTAVWESETDSAEYIFDLALDSSFTIPVDSIFPVSVKDTFLHINNLNKNTTYYYRIRSQVKDGISGYSNIVSTTTVWRPFSDNSPWNTKISPDTKTDSNSVSLIMNLASAANEGLHINYIHNSVPVYYVDSKETPRYNVINFGEKTSWNSISEQKVPIPDNISLNISDQGTNYLSIIDKKKNIEWGIQDAVKLENQWIVSNGSISDLSGTGLVAVSPEDNAVTRQLGIRPGGFPLCAGLIRVEEIQAGKIDHALIFAYPHCRVDFFVSPAGNAYLPPRDSVIPGGLPLGARIQLGPDYDIDNSSLSETGKIIARALQEYGAILGDVSHKTCLYAENSPEAIKEWGDKMDADILKEVFQKDTIKKYFRLTALGPRHYTMDEAYYTLQPTDFISFRLDNQISSTEIDHVNNVIKIKVAKDTPLDAVTADFYLFSQQSRAFVDSARQFSGKTENNFNEPVLYNVYNADSTSFEQWTVIVEHSRLNNKADIVSFGFEYHNPEIQIDTSAKYIYVEFNDFIDVTSLQPQFELSEGASMYFSDDDINQDKNDFFDFSDVVEMIIISEDSTNISTWKVYTNISWEAPTTSLELNQEKELTCFRSNYEIQVISSCYPVYLHIFDINGRLILAQELNNNQKSVNFNPQFNGIYVVRLMNEDTVSTKKIAF